jgi:hypothetical protein
MKLHAHVNVRVCTNPTYKKERAAHEAAAHVRQQKLELKTKATTRRGKTEWGWKKHQP